MAVCMSFRPDVLMLDEPTSALDSDTADRFFSNVRKFCTENGTTLIVVSHDDRLAEKYADGIIRLERKNAE